MKRWLATLLLPAVLVAFAVPSFGQSDALRDLELNLFFGGSFHTRNDFQFGFPQATPPVSAVFKVEDAFRGGVRFNVNNNGRWGQEFYYSYQPNNAVFIRNGPNPGRFVLPMQIHNVGVNGMLYFNDEEDAKHRPFASFGIGATIYKPSLEAKSAAKDPANANLPGFNQANEFSFNYGLGFKERINRVFGLRVDAKHFIGRHPSFSMSRESDDPLAPVFPAAGAIHNFEASGGIIFYFGR